MSRCVKILTAAAVALAVVAVYPALAQKRGGATAAAKHQDKIAQMQDCADRIKATDAMIETTADPAKKKKATAEITMAKEMMKKDSPDECTLYTDNARTALQ
jgi:hypothetical protein